MSAFRHPEIRFVGYFLRAEEMLRRRVALQQFFTPGHSLVHAAEQLAGEMERLARDLRSSAGDLCAEGRPENTRACPCCGGAGRKRREIYMGAGRYSDGGMVGCLTCDGRGEVAQG